MKGKSRLYCVFSKPTSPLDEGEIKTILCFLQAHIPTSSGDVGLEKTQYSLDFPFIQWGCGLREDTI
jgi:hypothetical protein